MILIYFILFSFAFSSNDLIVFPDRNDPTWGPVVQNFEQTCSLIKKEHDGLYCSTFISYAQPRSENPRDCVYNSWILSFKTFLELCGIPVFFDMNDGSGGFSETGHAIPYMNNIRTAQNVICMLTPSYKEKVDKRENFLSAEANLIMERGQNSVVYVGVSGSPSLSLPGCFIGVENKLISPFNKTFHNRENIESNPDANYFFECICDLLRPKTGTIFQMLPVSNRVKISFLIKKFINFKDYFIRARLNLRSIYLDSLMQRYPNIAMEEINKQSVDASSPSAQQEKDHEHAGITQGPVRVTFQHSRITISGGSLSIGNSVTYGSKK